MSANPPVVEPFHQPAQQRRAGFMGMYLFLASEIMLFGGIFAAVFVFRLQHPEATKAAAGHLKLWLGGANTAVLLTSSLFMALAVHAARAGAARRAAGWLAATATFGTVFLAIKGYEYWTEYTEGLMPHTEGAKTFADRTEWLFLNLYYVATSLHAFHLASGIVMVVGLAAMLARGWTPLPRRAVTVEMVGLYWHLIDVIWVFLYPVLYLAR